ncbi:hypothetical protein PF004_g33023 [Phytophthora fragariae]|uniref:Uncharacterized protein n=2 Tax=Phytophthora fragariae TaxID=53985 RepID=A0A6G0M5N4_9STRA|nr:hypothetical protein PF004_g33023 [Phytophthora fragariae]KAE9258703.1 hypothetical protein PF008_g33549 [Phytophthora fragariae]
MSSRRTTDCGAHKVACMELHLHHQLLDAVRHAHVDCTLQQTQCRARDAHIRLIVPAHANFARGKCLSRRTRISFTSNFERKGDHIE